MKASELIGKLADILKEHGDLQVYTFPAGKIAEPTVKVETLQWNIDAQQTGTADRPVVTLM